MKSSTRIIVTLIIGILLFASFYLVTGSISKFTGYFLDNNEKSDLELCLEEQAIGLYINSENVGPTLSNLAVKDHLDKFDIVNCAKNSNPCVINGINSFPTWIINNQKIEGDISLKQLKEYTGCKLITEK